MAEGKKPYPASLSVDYPDRELNRLTSFFRLIVIIPIAVILCLVTFGISNGDVDSARQHRWTVSFSIGGVLFLATMLMLVFRQKYPRWWFDWNIALTKFSTRVGAYLALLRDEYPSTDEEQAVHIEIPYPDARKDLNRWLPLVKWLLAIPHYIVLFFLGIAAFFVVIVAWFAILFTGRYPKGLFDFVVGVMRWSLRVDGIRHPADHRRVSAIHPAESRPSSLSRRQHQLSRRKHEGSIFRRDSLVCRLAVHHRLRPPGLVEDHPGPSGVAVLPGHPPRLGQRRGRVPSQVYRITAGLGQRRA